MPGSRQRKARQRLPRSVTPRPSAKETHAAASRAKTVHAPPSMREHHITTDFGYVRSDLAAIGVLTVLILGFIVAMRFVLG